VGKFKLAITITAYNAQAMLKKPLHITCVKLAYYIKASLFIGERIGVRHSKLR
jgi:hypothetical protein